jgi:hypothetical protein
MVVVSNEAAAMRAFRRIAGRQNPNAETEATTPQATLPLVTRMFLLGQERATAAQ